MKIQGWSPVIVFYAVALLGSVLHALMPAPPRSWPEVLPSLYFVPIVIAAINLGSRAAAGVAVASGVAHSIVAVWGCDEPWIRLVLQTLLYVGVGLTAAHLARMHEELAGPRHAVANAGGNGGLDRSYHALRSRNELPGFTQIVAGLIHRFRTPLASIEGAVWLLEDSRVPPDKREEFVGIIRKESHQLDRALSDILYFTQPRRPRFREVDASALFDEVIRLAGPKEHGPFFLFRKEMPPDLPMLRCDREQVRAMLLNLAMNSIQSMPGGGQITLSATVEGSNMHISVADHGRGISPEIASRVFDPFFTTRDNGLGLGLTVARTIVEAHGGNIVVNPSLSNGACITVVLPLDPSNAHEHGPHTGG